MTFKKSTYLGRQTYTLGDIVNQASLIQAFEVSRGGLGFDLREKINEILDKWGHYVLIRRNDKKLHCDCFDYHTQESAVRDCAVCDGEGYVPIIEKVLTRRWGIGDSPDTIENPGRIARSDRIYYFKHWVNPQVQDVIYEVTWVPNPHNGIPKSIVHVYSIHKAHAARADNGRIEYYRCESKEEFLNKSVRKINVRKNRNLVNYTIEFKNKGK